MLAVALVQSTSHSATDRCPFIFIKVINYICGCMTSKFIPCTGREYLEGIFDFCSEKGFDEKEEDRNSKLDLLRRISEEISTGKTTLYSTYKSPLASILSKMGIPSPFSTCTKPVENLSHTMEVGNIYTWLGDGFSRQVKISTI